MVGEIKWWLNYHEYQGNADEKAKEILDWEPTHDLETYIKGLVKK